MAPPRRNGTRARRERGRCNGTWWLDLGEHISGDVCRAGDIGLGVGEREKPGFKLRWREVNAALEATMEELRKGGFVRLLSVLEVPDFAAHEVETEHRADPAEVV